MFPTREQMVRGLRSSDRLFGEQSVGLRDISPCLSLSSGQADQIVLTHRDELDRIGKLVVGGPRVSVRGDELLRAFRPERDQHAPRYAGEQDLPNRYDTRQELHHLDRLIPL